MSDNKSSENKQLSESDWTIIRTAAEMGEKKPAELAREYGISPAAISQHFKKYNVVYGSKAKSISEKAEAKAVKKISDIVSEFALKRKQRIEETKEQSYQDAVTIRALTRKILVDVVNNPKATMAEKRVDLLAIKIAADVLALSRSERWSVLKINEDIDVAELPSITIQDLTQDEILEIQKSDDDVEDGFDGSEVVDEE